MLDWSIRRAWLAWGLLGLTLVGPVPAEGPRRPDQPELKAQQFKPHWRTGDQWIVETVTLQLQAGGADGAVARSKPLRWQFTVRGLERLHGRECYRVEVCPLVNGKTGPVAVFWADRQALALRQVQIQLPVAGRTQTITESYDFPAGQPSPVQGPLTALPIDMPLFLGGEVKGSGEFSYDALPGPPGQKAVGDLGFAVDIRQEMAPVGPGQVKGLLAEEFTKDIQTRPTVEVHLRSPLGRVRQLWRPGCPWPVYADNGVTVARLVKVIPARPIRNDPPEVRR